MVKRGNLLENGTPLIEIVKNDPIWANFNISERFLLDLERTSKREDDNSLDPTNFRFNFNAVVIRDFRLRDIWTTTIRKSTKTPERCNCELFLITRPTEGSLCCPVCSCACEFRSASTKMHF